MSVKHRRYEDFDPTPVPCVKCGREVHLSQLVNEGDPVKDNDPLKPYEGMCTPCVYDVKKEEEKQEGQDVLSPMQVEDVYAEVSDKTLKQILKETNSEAVIVFAFDKPLLTQYAPPGKFKIALANIDWNFIPQILLFLLMTIRGSLGKLTHRREGEL